MITLQQSCKSQKKKKSGGCGTPKKPTPTTPPQGIHACSLQQSKKLNHHHQTFRHVKDLENSPRLHFFIAIGFICPRHETCFTTMDLPGNHCCLSAPSHCPELGPCTIQGCCRMGTIPGIPATLILNSWLASPYGSAKPMLPSACPSQLFGL